MGPICEMGRKAGGWLHRVVTDRRSLVGRAGSAGGHNRTALPPWVLCSCEASSMELWTPGDVHSKSSLGPKADYHVHTLKGWSQGQAAVEPHWGPYGARNPGLIERPWKATTLAKLLVSSIGF